MPLTLTRIDYATLNSRQRENHNFQKVSAILADYGFATIRLSDDWQGADFIAQHVNGEIFLKVQLKGRLLFSKKYVGKSLYIAFHSDRQWYLYLHDELLERVLNEDRQMTGSRSWEDEGLYSFPNLSRQLRELLAPYKITGSVQPVADGDPA